MGENTRRFPSAIKRAQVSERRKMVWDLRIRGKDLQSIADEVIRRYTEAGRIDEIPPKYDTRHVHQDFKVVLEERKKVEEQDVTDYVRLDASRLDKMLDAIADRVEMGDLDAIETSRRLLERRAKLLGLDGPSRVDHTSGGLPIITVQRVSTPPPPAE
jgi:hypothetical protein